MGRPRAKDPRRNTVSVKLTDEELASFVKWGKVLGANVSEFIRATMLTAIGTWKCAEACEKALPGRLEKTIKRMPRNSETRIRLI